MAPVEKIMTSSEYLVSAESKANPLPVLVVSSLQEDHELFNVFLGSAAYSLHHAFTLADAVATLEKCPIHVMVTERTLPDGCWVDIQSPSLKPPLVIVFSDPEDASSWAQAFNVGAFDMFYRPLVEKIVEGSVSLASVRWSRMAELSSAPAENTRSQSNHDFFAHTPKRAQSAKPRSRLRSEAKRTSKRNGVGPGSR
jgi:DNA-binding NtrC family response regulator